jgi:hypothetical protein
MTRLAVSLSIAVALALAAGASDAAVRKIAVVVGSDVGSDPAKALQYAERDAAKIHEVLLELGGVARGDASLLVGADARAVWRALDWAEARVAEARGRGAQTMLLFYFSGHAAGDAMELGETSVDFTALKRFLASSKADVRLAFLDACQAGRLIASKGGRPGPAYNIRVADEIASTGYAIITSSAEDEASQESAELRGAFFTHYLVSALRGAGDASGDGRVTLDEAYQYAYRRTLARTAATIGGGQHAMYNFQLEGRGDIVLTAISGAVGRIAVNVPDSGRLVLLDGEGVSMVAETELAANRDAFLTAPPGDYVAYVATPSGAVRRARVTVAPGESPMLGPADFQTVALEQSISKGGLYADTDRDLAWRLAAGAGGLWRLFPLEGGSASYGATVHLRLESPGGWQPALRLTWATAEDAGVSRGYDDVGAALGFGRVLPLGFARLRVELFAGYEHLFQDPWQGESRHTSGFAYLCLVGLELPANRFRLGVEAGSGGRVFQVIDKGWVHRVDFQAALYAAWSWEVRP